MYATFKKIKQVKKTLDKDNENICKKVLIAGQNACDMGGIGGKSYGRREGASQK